MARHCSVEVKSCDLCLYRSFCRHRTYSYKSRDDDYGSVYHRVPAPPMTPVSSVPKVTHYSKPKKPVREELEISVMSITDGGEIKWQRQNDISLLR